MFLEKEKTPIFIYIISSFGGKKLMFCEIVKKKKVNNYFFKYFYKLNVKRLKDFKHLF